MVATSSLLYSLGYAITKELIRRWQFDAMQLFVLRSLLVLAGLSPCRCSAGGLPRSPGC